MSWRSAVNDFPAGSMWLDLIRYPNPTAGREAAGGGIRKEVKRKSISIRREWANGVLMVMALDEPLAIDFLSHSQWEVCVSEVHRVPPPLSSYLFLIPKFHYPWCSHRHLFIFGLGNVWYLFIYISQRQSWLQEI